MSQHDPATCTSRRSLHPDLCRTSIMINCDTQGYKLKLLLFGTFVALTRYCAGGDNKGKSMKSLAIILAVGMLGAAVPASAFEPASATSVQNRQDQRDYGRWDDRWGARPPAPPRHWTRSRTGTGTFAPVSSATNPTIRARTPMCPVAVKRPAAGYRGILSPAGFAGGAYPGRPRSARQLPAGGGPLSHRHHRQHSSRSRDEHPPGRPAARRVVQVDQVRNGWLHIRGQGWISGQFARRA